MKTPIRVAARGRHAAARQLGAVFLSGVLLGVHGFAVPAALAGPAPEGPARAVHAGTDAAMACGPLMSVAMVGDTAHLPEKVAAMRDAILSAARSGDIEALRPVVEWNELPPEVGAGKEPDPIAYWKRISADGDGRDILAILVSILEMPPAVVGGGSTPERFVWPGIAEVPPGTLTPAQQVQLLRLMPVAEAKTVRAAKTWKWYRLSIGVDGTWHAFDRAE